MGIVLGIIFLIVALANLWFWIRTLIIMNRENILFAIGGFFIAPIVQIVFFLMHKDSLDDSESSAFKKYFICIGLIFVLAFAAPMFMGPMLAAAG